MVHILKHGSGEGCMYLLLNKEPIVKDLRKLGFEMVGELDLRLKQGQYTPQQLSQVLRNLKAKKMLRIS